MSANGTVSLPQRPYLPASKEMWELPIPDGGCIDPDGDLILDLPDNLSLLVSSTVLSHISPVFNVLLNGGFMENTPRDAKNKGRVSLEEDDAELLKSTILAAHGKPLPPFLTDSRFFSIDKLVALASLADKYDCMEVVRVMTEKAYTHICTRGPPMRDVAILAGYAALLNMDVEFYKLTSAMVRCHTTRFAEIRPSWILTAEMLSLLDSIRSQMHDALHECINTFNAIIRLRNYPTLNPRTPRIRALRDSLRDLPHSWTIRDLRTVAEDPIITRPRDLARPPSRKCDVACSCAFTCDMQAVSAMATGLCLRCARAGVPSAVGDSACRHGCQRTWDIGEAE